LLDIGSGAGFPAIPIALANRDKKIILVEPLKKKSSFLHYVKTILELENIEIYSDRVENLNIDEVDLITSRAVTETETLINLAKPFIKQGGKLLFYKGSNLPTEIQGLKYKFQIEKRDNRNYLIVEF
jgi:16S rRNA (guanine527-N7)-methyltransferase